ncbi:hypothetical protein Q4577_08645 [Marinovum sp. 2_MG-2023]|uniref:hypothetical protein n=1 Tax=Roseobacteraceae TaxID=2854170 RepID=UPI001FD4E5C4|nr:MULTISPECIES: hypothetical protein [Roseobacteraceae]MCJ7872844.1 hypothetical protein [Phaeobacter sp. J2-8]MDO6730084.1 hypothetical protein [Marinovum sp. 2_MG-2023]MDO6779898.1 hypothetical protein [Marinovum sp. 1_MG-2023]
MAWTFICLFRLGAMMVVSFEFVAMGAAGLLVGAAVGWGLRGMRRQKVPQRAELDRLRNELRGAIGLLADREARIATLEADLEIDHENGRCGEVRFGPERCGPQLTRQYG